MPSKIKIRLAKVIDAESLVKITDRSVRGLAKDSYSQDQINSWMNGRSKDTYIPRIKAGRVHIAEQNGEPIGYIDVIPGEIICLFIIPEASGKGLGRLLMEIGLPLSRINHDGPIVIEATLNAEPFYAKFGFTSIGRGYFSHGVPETPGIEIVKMTLA